MNKKEAYELSFWKEHGFHKYGRDFYVQKHNDRLDEFNQMHQLPGHPDKCLEVGCGPFGGMSMSYGAKEWILLDPLADEYLKVVSSEHQFVQSGVESMPLEGGAFDVVFCCNVLDHTDDYIKGMREIHRVLKEGGLLCVFVHCRKKSELNDGHPHSFTYDEIKECFRDNGFSIVASKEYHDCYDTFMGVLRKDAKI